MREFTAWLRTIAPQSSQKTVKRLENRPFLSILVRAGAYGWRYLPSSYDSVSWNISARPRVWL